MAKVKVISDYESGRVHFEAGQVLDVSPGLALHLLNDAPGCFEMVEERPELPEAPPVNRMMKPVKRKGSHE